MSDQFRHAIEQLSAAYVALTDAKVSFLLALETPNDDTIRALDAVLKEVQKIEDAVLPDPIALRLAGAL